MEVEKISAAEASRDFSRILEGVREGRRYVITADGKPVAQIGPVSAEDRFRARAKELLLARLRSQPVIDIGPWTRDELYDRSK